MYKKALLSICMVLLCVCVCHGFYKDIVDLSDSNHDSYKTNELMVHDRIVSVNAYEKHIATKCMVLNPQQQEYVIGHQSIIDEIDSISDMWTVDSNLGPLHKPPTGILLHGPPGTGKTTLSKYISQTIFGGNVSFLNVSSDTFENKYQGEGLKCLRAVFTLAVKVSPCVLFFDEIDGFMSKRSDADQTHVNGMKTTFLSGMDHVNDHSHILVVCATNRPKALDKALMRRMEIHFHTDFPSVDEKCRVMKSFEALGDEDVSRFVHETLPHKTTIHDINTFLRFCVRKKYHKTNKGFEKWSFDTLNSVYDEYKSVFKYMSK